MKNKNWTGDLAGGVVAAIMTLPEAMAYGVLVFSSLDSSLAADGLLAGLVAVTMANLGSSLVKGNPIISSGPFSLVTLMIASQIPVFLDHHFSSDHLVSPPTELVLSLVFWCIFMAGLFQVAFGQFHLGQLVKYVPRPVVSGLFNGTALLIMAGQINPLLGISDTSTSWKPLNLFIGLLTLVSVELGTRRLRKVPPAILALLIGLATYHICHRLGYSDRLGPMIGQVPTGIPQPTALIPIIKIMDLPQVWKYLSSTILFSLALAVTASLGTLVGCIAGDEVQRARTNANHELIGQGLGNMLSALFGGIMSSGSPSRTVANYQYGGRSRLSRVSMGIFSLAVILLLSRWIELLPKVVLAGLLVSLAVSLLQPDTWQQLLGLFANDGLRRQRAAIDFAISLSVTSLLLWKGILPALAAGLLISLIHFAFRMGKEIITQHQQADVRHSFAIRSQEEFQALTKHGNCIHLLSLQGSLFFGTADQLAVRIEQLGHQGARWILLDLGEVVELDSTGSQIMAQSIRWCRDQGIEIAIAAKSGSILFDLLSALGLLSIIGNDHIFPTLNHALVWAEDQLLDQKLPDDRYQVERPLNKVNVFSGMKNDEIEIIKKYLTWHQLPDTSLLIEQSVKEDWMLILVEGRARVELALETEEESHTVSIMCSGRLIGELAFVDHQPRSASVFALGEVKYWKMSYANFLSLQQENAWIAHRLMQGIASEISTKLRISDRMIG